jgi:hypothetical protein
VPDGGRAVACESGENKGGIALSGLAGGTHNILLEPVTTNRNYQIASMTAPASSWSATWAADADMETGDTAFVRLTVSNGAKTVNVLEHATIVATNFQEAMAA